MLLNELISLEARPHKISKLVHIFHWQTKYDTTFSHCFLGSYIYEPIGGGMPTLIYLSEVMKNKDKQAQKSVKMD